MKNPEILNENGAVGEIVTGAELVAKLNSLKLFSKYRLITVDC